MKVKAYAALAAITKGKMVAGTEITKVLDDDWTVSTVDGSDASHWEHTIAIHEGGIWVLTASDGGAAELMESSTRRSPMPRPTCLS